MRLLSFLVLLILATLSADVAVGQLGPVTPSERIVAGQRVNAFVDWEGTVAIEGLRVTMPAGWLLRDARAFRRGTHEETPFQIASQEGEEGTFVLKAPSALKGPQRIILGVSVGLTVGFATTELVPLAPETGAPLHAHRRLWAVYASEAPSAASGRAFQRAPGGAPTALRRSALPGLQAHDDYTVEFWMSTSGLDEVVLSTWNGREGQTYPFEVVVGPRGTLSVYRGEPRRHSSARSLLPVADGQWHHVALVHTARDGLLRLLIDGVSVDTLWRHAPPGMYNNMLPVTLGGRRAGLDGEPEDAFSGLIDELRIWPVARREDEIVQTMRQRFSEAPGSLAQLDFERPIPSGWLVDPEVAGSFVPSNLSFAREIERLMVEPARDEVMLSWETHSRTVDHFQVERSTDGRNFQRVGTVDGSAPTRELAGGSLQFSYTDSPPTMRSLFYRVRMVTADARPFLSPTVRVGLRIAETATPEITGVTPNPFAVGTVIQFHLPSATMVELIILDADGNRVALLAEEELAAGRHEINFSAERLPAGFYLVRLRTPGSEATRRITLAR